MILSKENNPFSLYGQRQFPSVVNIATTFLWDALSCTVYCESVRARNSLGSLPDKEKLNRHLGFECETQNLQFRKCARASSLKESNNKVICGSEWNQKEFREISVAYHQWCGFSQLASAPSTRELLVNDFNIASDLANFKTQSLLFAIIFLLHRLPSKTGLLLVWMYINATSSSAIRLVNLNPYFS